jgi:hypothetical protein
VNELQAASILGVPTEPPPPAPPPQVATVEEEVGSFGAALEQAFSALGSPGGNGVPRGPGVSADPALGGGFEGGLGSALDVPPPWLGPVLPTGLGAAGSAVSSEPTIGQASPSWFAPWPSTGDGTGGVDGADVVADATRYLGVRYAWGGTSPATGFDCSGLVQRVFADLGIALPRTSEEQAQVGEAVPSLTDARPGDLLFFDEGPGGPGHVGIYVGSGLMLDAPHTGADVRIEPVWTSSLVAIRRVVPPSPTPPGGGVLGMLGWGAGAGSTDSATERATDSATVGAIPASARGATPGPLGVGLDAPQHRPGLGGVPSWLAPLFLDAAARTGLPPELLAAVAKVESGFDPTAVSPAGAEGLMQLMPSTAQSMGVDPFDPAEAVNAAASLLSSYLQRFGSLPLALAAYNAGPGAVERFGGVPPYPETEAYVANVLATMQELGGRS